MNRIEDLIGRSRKQKKQEGMIMSIDDPRLEPAKQYVAANGGDPKNAFIEMAKQRGYNIQQNATPYEALKIIMASGNMRR